MNETQYGYVAENPEFAEVMKGYSVDTLELNRPPSLIRKLVELMFYFVMLMTTFPHLMGGLTQVPNALGAIQTSIGGLAFLLMLTQREKIPISIWFAVAINVFANFSEVIGHGAIPIIGEGTVAMLHWVTGLLMVCYLVQNEATYKRLLLFHIAIVLIAVKLGGTGTFETGSAIEAGRLGLLEAGFAVTFMNPNTLGCLAGFLAVASLFWSLRSAIVLKPVLWSLAAVLIFVVFVTVSRSAILITFCGLMVLVLAVLMGRGVRLAGIILIIVGMLVVAQFGYMLTSHMELLGERMGRRSVRLDVYTVETIDELLDTMLIGKGTLTRLKHAGILPHNVFLSVHLFYGAPAAWAYALWIIILGLRTLRMMRHREVPLDQKLMIVALFGMTFGLQMCSNHGYVHVQSILATAVIERFTAPYSWRRIKMRLIAQQVGHSEGYEPELSAYPQEAGSSW